MQVTVSPRLTKKSKRVTQFAQELLVRKIERAIDTLDDNSVVPVDTGAYVTSFSFSTGAGRPRGKSSKGKPRTNPQAARSEGLSNLIKDLERIPSLLDTTSIVLRNNSPHAVAVEYGGRGWKTSPYFVFTKLRNIHG